MCIVTVHVLASEYTFDLKHYSTQFEDRERVLKQPLLDLYFTEIFMRSQCMHFIHISKDQINSAVEVFTQARISENKIKGNICWSMGWDTEESNLWLISSALTNRCHCGQVLPGQGIVLSAMQSHQGAKAQELRNNVNVFLLAYTDTYMHCTHTCLYTRTFKHTTFY